MAQTRMTQDARGERPSLDALNQTIEGLESRLADMMANRASARRPAPSQPPRERPSRERPSTNPDLVRTNAELREISSTLKDLRAAVREDFTDSLRDELAGLYDMLSHLDRQTDTLASDEQTRSELLRISEGVDWLLSNAAASTDDPLMAEFEHLQTLIRGLASSDSMARLETRFDTLEHHLAPFDPARLDGDLSALAYGLDDIRQRLDRSQTDTSLNDIENRLTALARAMEVLCTRIPASGRKLDGQMSAIERRIEDIDRNIELIGRRQGEVQHDPTVERLENRFAELASAVAAIDWQMRDQGTKQTTLLESLEDMASRLKEHSADDGHLRLEARLDKLTAAVENITPGIDRRTLGQAVSELSDKIGRIDLQGSERRIAARLDALDLSTADDDSRDAVRDELKRLSGLIENQKPGLRPEALDAAVSKISDTVSRIDMAGAERRIADKIDNAAASGFSEQDRRDLQQQFDRLSALVERNGHSLDPRALEDAVRRINQTIGGIDLQGSERRITARLDALDLSTADDDSRTAVREELKRLSGLIENQKPGLRPEALEAAVSKINDTVSRIDMAGAERRLSAQIAAMPAPTVRDNTNAIDPEAFEKRLAARIEALDLAGTEERLARRIADLAQNGSDERISAQLTALADRFEESRRDMSAPALQKLERQIAELTTLVGRPDPKQPFAELEERIGARIENLTASNDDYLIEAAQHAAEEALKNFEERRKGETDEHIAVLKALAADLKNLQQAGRDSDGTAGLHDTLKTISDRLDTLNAEDGETATETEGRRAETGPFVAPAPSAATAEASKAAETEAERQEPPRFEMQFPAAAPQPSAASSVDTQADDASDDVMDILSRVRAGQAPKQNTPVLPVHDRPVAKTEYKKREPGQPAGMRNQRFAAGGPQGDLIAAARRAARSALENAEDMTPSVSPAKPSEKDEDSAKQARDGFSRRPVYLAAGAILLAIIAYPFLSDTGKDREAILQATKAFDKAPPSLRAPAPATPPQQAISGSTAKQNVAAAPSLRSPDRAAVKTNFAAEAREIAAAPAVRAFQMFDTDNSLVTGSIKPDAPATPARASAPAPAQTPVAAPEPPPATRPPEISEETASVTTKDVLDMLAEPSPTRQASASPKAASGNDKAAGAKAPLARLNSGSQPEASQARDALAAQRPKDPAPLDIDVPATIKPAALADAARNGNPDALYEIGMRYQDGLGLKRDPAEAAIWFDAAAERGSAPAAFQLGSLYEKGVGVDRDAAEAITLYRKAARAGNVSAMHNLAVMLANGADGGTPDFAEAAKWFRAAADHGVADSQFNLAIMHARGAGVDADLAQSYKWFAIAARNGDPEAANRRDEVTEALSKADLDRGRKLAADWEAETPLPAANQVVPPAEWLPQEAAASAPDKQAIIRDIQSILNERGYDAGPEDGLLGARTDAAIKAFQSKNGLKADGAITPALVETLLSSNSA